MSPLVAHSRHTLVLFSLLICFVIATLFLNSTISSKATGASTMAQATPTCPPSGCVYNRAYGYQPRRYDMRSTFNDAASNALGNNGPSYNQINRGLPPNMTQETVSASRPIPHIILRGMAWQESRWLQFANSMSDPDGTYACTLIGYDPGGTCGYGLMQITTCMNEYPLPPACTWLSPTRVAGEWPYNLGTGVNMLIQKWNAMPFIGDNDHAVPEEWYYAVMAYNSWSTTNDPNSNNFNPRRPPYGESNYTFFNYPYQERVWGWITHPELAQAGFHWLWRPTRLAAVPRGIFGLRGSGDWRPPSQTPKPVFHMLPAVRVASGVGPSITLRNTTGQTLAVDVLFYNQDGTFNRRWLDPSPNPPWYRWPYIRLNANSSRTLIIANAFPGEDFTGYALIIASEGIEVTLQPPSYPNKVFLPLALKNYGGNCYNEIWNGGFEEFVDGRPRYWTVSSADAYSLADGTWFASGHYGAYLGGYDWADDVLRQYVYIPGDALSANLTYGWYMRTEETHPSNQYDFLYIRLRDTGGRLVTTLDTLSNQSLEGTWQTASFDLLAYAGQGLQLSFEADTDVSNPTSFFVDDASLWICRP